MKTVLKKTTHRLYHHNDNGSEVDGPNSKLTGDTSKIFGDCCGLSGDVSGLRGDVSGLSGYVSGLRGDVSGLSGDVDECDLTPAERAVGVKVQDLAVPDRGAA